MKRGTPDHPKTLDLAERLGIEQWGAVGILESIWHFSSRFAVHGDLGKFSDANIARGIGWKGDSELLISALVLSGWLDECQEKRLIVHDWQDHADDAVQKYISRHNSSFPNPKPPIKSRYYPNNCPDKSRQVAKCPPRARALPLPEPLSKPEPKPEPSGSPSAVDSTSQNGSDEGRRPNVWGEWIDANRKAKRKDPIKTGPNLAASKTIGELIPDETERRKILDVYLADKDPWIIGQGYSLANLPKRIDAYRNGDVAERRNGRPETLLEAQIRIEKEVFGGRKG